MIKLNFQIKLCSDQENIIFHSIIPFYLEFKGF